MDARSLSRILLPIFDVTALAPLAAWAWSRKRGWVDNRPWRRALESVVFLDLCFGLVFVGLAYGGFRNLPLMHFGRPIVLLSILWALHRMVPGPLSRRAVWALMGVSFLVASLGIFLDGLRNRNQLFTIFQGILLLVLSARGLRALVASDHYNGRLTHLQPFWVLAGLLVLSATTLAFNALGNHFLRVLPPSMLPIPWLVNYAFISLYHLSLARAFLCPPALPS